MIEFLIITLSIGVLALAVLTHQSRPKTKPHRVKYNQTMYLDKEFVSRKWNVIQQLSRGNGSNLRDAVSEADKLLDYALKHTGTKGDTMGERLKNSRGRFSDLNAIWRAHKLRNALAHESHFDLVPSQAREAISDLEQGLKDLKAL